MDHQFQLNKIKVEAEMKLEEMKFNFEMEQKRSANQL
jgi:hypothetical protein